MLLLLLLLLLSFFFVFCPAAAAGLFRDFFDCFSSSTISALTAALISALIAAFSADGTNSSGARRFRDGRGAGDSRFSSSILIFPGAAIL